MVQVTGRNGTVTFEVHGQDPETENLLHQALSTHINALVDYDKTRLQSIAAKNLQKKSRDEIALTPKEKYAKENLEKPELIALGGEWAYSVAIATDQGGGKVVRIAKGKIKGNYYRDKLTNKMVLIPNDPMDPITLPTRINIKRMSDWESLQAPVISRLRVLDATKQ